MSMNFLMYVKSIPVKENLNFLFQPWLTIIYYLQKIIYKIVVIFVNIVIQYWFIIMDALYYNTYEINILKDILFNLLWPYSVY